LGRLFFLNMLAELRIHFHRKLGSQPAVGVHFMPETNYPTSLQTLMQLQMFMLVHVLAPRLVLLTLVALSKGAVYSLPTRVVSSRAASSRPVRCYPDLAGVWPFHPARLRTLQEDSGRFRISQEITGHGG